MQCDNSNVTYIAHSYNRSSLLIMIISSVPRVLTITTMNHAPDAKMYFHHCKVAVIQVNEHDHILNESPCYRKYNRYLCRTVSNSYTE